MKFIIVLIALAFAAVPNIQHDMPVEKTSRLVRALTNMVYLQQQSQQIDYSRLFNAIDDLESHVAEAKSAENILFQQDQVQYFSDRDFYENQQTQYETEVAQHQVDIADLTETRDGFQKQLDQSKWELGQTTGLSADLNKLIASDEKTYNEQLQEYDQAIENLDEASALISQSSSLVQLDIKKLKKTRVFYQPLVAALTQLKNTDFANQELVSKVTKLLNQLRASLASSRSSLTSQFQNVQSQNKAIAVQYEEKIQNLTEELIPEAQNNILVKDDEIKAKNGLLSDAQGNLQSAIDNLKLTDDAWIKRSNENTKLNKQYDNDLSSISQVRASFDRAGIKK